MSRPFVIKLRESHTVFLCCVRYDRREDLKRISAQPLKPLKVIVVVCLFVCSGSMFMWESKWSQFLWKPFQVILTKRFITLSLYLWMYSLFSWCVFFDTFNALCSVMVTIIFLQSSELFALCSVWWMRYLRRSRRSQDTWLSARKSVLVMQWLERRIADRCNRCVRAVCKVLRKLRKKPQTRELVCSVLHNVISYNDSFTRYSQHN